MRRKVQVDRQEGPNCSHGSGEVLARQSWLFTGGNIARRVRASKYGRARHAEYKTWTQDKGAHASERALMEPLL
eukprot:5387139-Pleurochrysis_carterae.AAC.1